MRRYTNQASKQSSAVGQRILVVDRDSSVRESLGHALTIERYDVLTAASADQARKHLLSQRVELILLDLDLPGESSWEMADWLAAEHAYLPIIATTTEPGRFDRALASGADALMEKPFRVPCLLKKMETLLTNSEQVQLNRVFATLRLLKKSRGIKGVQGNETEC